MRPNDVNKATPPPPPPTPCYMRHSKNFDKIGSFLKPILNIIVLRNLIAGWERGLLKRGLAFCIKYIDLEEILKVGESSIHQSKSWYYLRLFKTFKVELLAKAIFGYKPLNYFAKSYSLDVSLIL